MTIVHETIDAEVALLARDVAMPVAPFGYGSDLSCATDLTEDMEELDGSDPQVLAEACIRRITTRRESLPGDPNYGIDVREACCRGMTDREVTALAGKLRLELEQDDRIQRVLVVITPEDDGETLNIALSVTPVDSRLGPFRLTLAVTSAAVLVEELAAA